MNVIDFAWCLDRFGRNLGDLQPSKDPCRCRWCALLVVEGTRKICILRKWKYSTQFFYVLSFRSHAPLKENAFARTKAVSLP